MHDAPCDWFCKHAGGQMMKSYVKRKIKIYLKLLTFEKFNRYEIIAGPAIESGGSILSSTPVDRKGSSSFIPSKALVRETIFIWMKLLEWCEIEENNLKLIER